MSANRTRPGATRLDRSADSARPSIVGGLQRPRRTAAGSPGPAPRRRRCKPLTRSAIRVSCPSSSLKFSIVSEQLVDATPELLDRADPAGGLARRTGRAGRRAGIVSLLRRSAPTARGPGLRAYASSGSQLHTRLRSPYAASIRDTGGKYLLAAQRGHRVRCPTGAGTGGPSRRADRRRCAGRSAAGCSSIGHSPASMLVDLGSDRDHRVTEALELVQRPRSRSARSSACRPPGSSSSVRGSRSRSAAWRRRRR